MFLYRTLAFAVVPVLAFTLYACGPKPEAPTETPAPPATTAPDMGTPAAPPAGETPAPGVDAGTPAPGADMGTPAPGGEPVAEEILGFVEEMPKTVGKDGKLQVKGETGVMAYEIVEILKDKASKTPDGKSSVPAKAKSDKGEVELRILVVGTTKADAKIDSMIVTENGADTVYNWIEGEKMFGALTPSEPGAPAEPGAASPAPGETPAAQ